MGSRPTHYPAAESPPPPRTPSRSVLLSCLRPKGSVVGAHLDVCEKPGCVWLVLGGRAWEAWGHFRAWLPTLSCRTMGAPPDTRLHCGALSGTHTGRHAAVPHKCAAAAEHKCIEAHPAASSRFPEEESLKCPSWPPWGHLRLWEDHLVVDGPIHWGEKNGCSVRLLVRCRIVYPPSFSHQKI